MKKNFYRNLACMLILTGGLCMSTNTEAQVTVGSKGVPNKGALLDIKQEDKADGSANSKKGLGLPRVALTAVDKLDPCVATTGVAATDDAAKKSHIGLTVYNTTDNTAGAATLSEGVYAWDGAMWTQYSGTTAGGAENGLSMSGKKVILGGSLNRPTTITGDVTNNLTLNTPTKVGSTLAVTGATTLGSTLGVTGATTLTGNLTSNGTTALKATNISGATTIASTGSLTLAGNGAGAGKVLTSDTNGKGTWQTPTYESTTASNGVTLSGSDVQLGGALTKNTLITGTNTLGLNVPTTVGSTLAVTGATTLGSTLAVTGATTLNDVTVGTTAAKKTATVNGNLIVTGNSKTATSTVTGNETVGGTLVVTGTTTLNGNLTSNGTTALKNTNVTGNLTVTGNESVGGSSTIGMNTTTPTLGALLEIRNKQQDLTGVADVLDPKMVTSDKGGLLLPRVKLVNLASLEPFITGADTKTKLSLAGLMVYNIAVSGDKIYPAFYVWSGTSWETPQQSASTLVIDNSVGVKTKAFTFYELGTETPVPLTVTVSGAFGAPTYQWYQVTGNNIHVRTGSKIIGATSASFLPVNGTAFNAAGDITASESVLKGTTRNANNTGFYRYYCVVSDAYRTVETETVEVAVGCGAKNINGDWTTFMCFNLGAGKSLGTISYSGVTIKEQRETTLPSYAYTNAAGQGIVHEFVTGEDVLWGDLFQAGRIPDGHEKRTSTTFNYTAVTTAMIADGARCSDGSNPYPRSQVIKTSSAINKFIIGSNVWNPSVNTSIWSLVNNDPCTRYQTDGSYQAFWNDAPTGTTNASSLACKGSSTGWRLPQREEFGSMYKSGLLQGSLPAATANTINFYLNGTSTANTKTNGLDIMPDGKTITLFLPAGGNRTNVQDGPLVGPGKLFLPGYIGAYWTVASATNTDTYAFNFRGSGIEFITHANARGLSIRCIKNQ